ncbi:hypothetical protein VSS37_08895 [Candidatus Thiothrix sp. Deng01]|uniref:YMGG-like Gly-zipper domain-containing protein n=2 Tax=Thiothrix TaxID=1030 RepID=A0A7L6AUJ3_9GAMM|nr:hypothetical protein [Candidatus Thiothrix sp. Deng01]MEB4591092.1 hypothetical protein [Candidatus Thiothrix sp. Deng01]QLQ32780.1 MAG: hypothetical protein HZT40_15625 [Candidatus Thiothrix singaporensis]
MRITFIICVLFTLQGCAVQVASSVAGATVGAATGAAVAVAKTPFKVVGAIAGD